MQLLCFVFLVYFGYRTHNAVAGYNKKLHKIATCRRGFLACQHGLPIRLSEQLR